MPNKKKKTDRNGDMLDQEILKALLRQSLTSQERSLERCVQIVNSFVEVVQERGSLRMDASDVSTRINITRTSLYRYFREGIKSISEFASRVILLMNPDDYTSTHLKILMASESFMCKAPVCMPTEAMHLYHSDFIANLSDRQFQRYVQSQMLAGDDHAYARMTDDDEPAVQPEPTKSEEEQNKPIEGEQ